MYMYSFRIIACLLYPYSIIESTDSISCVMHVHVIAILTTHNNINVASDID